MMFGCLCSPLADCLMSWNLQSRSPLTDAVQDQDGGSYCKKTVQDLLGIQLVQFNIITVIAIHSPVTSQPMFTDIPKAELIQTNNSNA